MEQSHLIIYNLPLYKAALNDNWEKAKSIFDQDPSADSAIITNLGQTPLHIAVGTNSSHEFMYNLRTRFLGANEIHKLADCDYEGNTPLHYAARAGNLKATGAMLQLYSQEDTQRRNQYGHTALRLAASYRQINTLSFLLSRTDKIEHALDGDIIPLIITAGFYDIALRQIMWRPDLATEKDMNGSTALQILATQPKSFPSGRNWWFWKHIIYFCITLKYTEEEEFLIMEDIRKNFKSPYIRCVFGYVSFQFGKLIWNVAKCLVPFLKTIHDQKHEHKMTNRLMKVLFESIVDVDGHNVPFDVLGKVMSTATKHGILELVEECLEHYPGLISNKDEGLNFVMSAIKYRQVKVYNLVYQMTKHEVLVATPTRTYKNDNPLHLAGRMPDPYILNDVTGAALQMQRELQWFKAVEKYADPFFKDDLNEDNATPQMVFTDEHKELVAQGEKWMKDTATSSLVVTALITTVAFAAIFTVPGGNKQESGIPYFLSDSTFMLFASFDALALFSSITSLLMFVAILTSRFAEQDFLYALPKRMTIGLLALFISIAAIMVTFCAALALVLREELAWIAIPVGLLGCVPVGLFTLLQFPLLVELVLSTYGPSIFHKQNKSVLH